jgi:hypothetical protein
MRKIEYLLRVFVQPAFTAEIEYPPDLQMSE